jgi:hypothetical protein
VSLFLVVKHFDAIEHIPSGFLTINVDFAANTLTLEKL